MKDGTSITLAVLETGEEYLVEIEAGWISL